MTIRTLTPPGAEPVALSEMKLVLRVDHDDEDTLIAALTQAARERVEAASGLALITRAVVQTLDRWPGPGKALRLGIGPVQAVSAVRTLAESGAASVFAAENYYADLTGFPARLAPAGGARWPRPGRAVGGIEIAYVAGFGDAPEDVPEALRQAVRDIAADAYERGGTPGTISPATQALLAPFRAVRL